MNNPFYNRSFLKLIDFSKDEISLLLDIAQRLKQQKEFNNEDKHLQDKNIALIFEKSSTRTRIAFEVAAHDQGANITYLEPNGSQIGHKESMEDTARVIGGMYDAIQYRGYGQDIVQTLADYSGVPVFNGLTNEYHPTQGLADLLTMREHADKPLSDVSFCFVGDCRFNMANTSLLAAAIMGMDVRLLCPDELQPNPIIIAKAQELAKTSGAKITITNNADTALLGCNFVHTDVWVPMGEPQSIWQQRIELLKNYQVNAKMLEKTKNPKVKFMHCLPAFHNRKTAISEEIFQKFGLTELEVSDEVFESDASIVFAQANNRLHTIKAVMVTALVKDIDFIV
ncbi:MAG: ornithine carbamoyltransferase [Gammaproteobacteria bacterium]|nr:ornithine carbamoyltransferase [Gammaproteobacteria bacterium]